jgi:transglutaminase-like putative cysteine protease
MLKNKLIILIFLLGLVSVGAESDLSYQVFNVQLDAGVDLDYTSSKSRLVHFTSDLSFFPKNYYNQEVLKLDLNSNPRASIKKGRNVVFKWRDVKERSLNYGFDSDVKVKMLIPRIDKEIAYPNGFILEENIPYTKKTEYIDINSDIKDKAKEITRNSDDLYEAVFKIAEWIRQNIEYDLNTLTEEVLQKSSWVLENKYGVCDEITNLFISLLRSLKIPAKYVVGIAYTDAVEEGWAPHAWAEVYFDGYGWVPFDITFGQYGRVDAGHIKFDDAIDSKKSSVEYNWKAVKIDLESKELGLKSELIENGEKILPFVSLDVNVMKNKVGEGSFVPIEVSVKNLQPYFLTTLVYVTSAPSVIGDNTQAVLLGPLEEKKIYWLVKVDEDLSSGFVYKADVGVGNNFGASAESKLDLSSVYPVFTEKEARFMMKRAEQGLEPLLEKDVREKKEERGNIIGDFLDWLFSGFND